MKQWILYILGFVAVFAIWQIFWRTTFFLADLKLLPLFIVAACVCGLIVMKIRKRSTK